jgi:LmbE family N-acetylglucosaminyl deacetylase
MSAVFGKDLGVWDRPQRWLVLAPHPDDFDAVAVMMRRLADSGCELYLEVLTGGASGVEDEFTEGWEAKTVAREEEQLESCAMFGLATERVKFHRLDEDEAGHMRDFEGNEARVRGILDRVNAEGVILPHGSDSNADHRRTFRYFEKWARERKALALLVKDPKSLEMRVDLVTLFNEEEAAWKGALLRCHRSQHERNLRSRNAGFDERILSMNREIGREVGAEFAEGFEVFEG